MEKKTVDEGVGFKDVGVEQWTSFNSGHTSANMETVDWALKNNIMQHLGVQDTVIDFGCGTGETTIKIGALNKFGKAQVIGLDTNMEFIKHATETARKTMRNNVSFFWGEYADDMKFLKSQCSIITCFTVLHLLTQLEVYSCLNLCHSLLRPKGHVLMLHYLGRSQECFQVHNKVFQELKVHKIWKKYLENSKLKTLERFVSEKESNRAEIVLSVERSGFKIIKKCDKIFPIVINYNVWDIIFRKNKLRKAEFGAAYENIPEKFLSSFLEDFVSSFEKYYPKMNCHSYMIIAEKV